MPQFNTVVLQLTALQRFQRHGNRLGICPRPVSANQLNAALVHFAHMSGVDRSGAENGFIVIQTLGQRLMLQMRCRHPGNGQCAVWPQHQNTTAAIDHFQRSLLRHRAASLGKHIIVLHHRRSNFTITAALKHGGQLLPYSSVQLALTVKQIPGAFGRIHHSHGKRLLFTAEVPVL